jgi:hypothetical protein
MIEFNDVAVAFSRSGDCITWKYNEDILISIQYGQKPLYIYRQGQAYVPGSKLRSYKNTWPIECIPPRHKYYYINLDAFYYEHYSTHPNRDCQNEGSTFCPVCLKRSQDRQTFLYLMCIPTVPRIVFIPHFLNRNTISPSATV